MLDSIVKVVRGIMRIRGGTDGTIIGNTGDALRTTLSIPTNGLPITFEDSMYLDSASKLKMSSPLLIFKSAFTADREDYQWSETVANGASSNLNTNHASIDMVVSTATGSKVVRQTRRTMYYLPGYGKSIIQTFVLNPPVANLLQNVGSFNTKNGVFLQQNGLTTSFVLRSSISGAPVDTVINQSSWNKDKLDGTGASGITLDVSKIQIMFHDVQWLGGGRIRIGFNIGGKNIVAHEFRHSNIISTVFTPNAKWPLRLEIENLASMATPAVLQHLCSSVIIDGGHEEQVGTPRTTNNGTTGRSMSSGTPTLALALRPYTENTTVVPNKVGIMVTSSNDVFYQLIFNATITGGSWVAAGDHSEVNVSSTAVSGGIVISSGYIKSGSQVPASSMETGFTLFLGRDLQLVADTLSVVITPLASNGTVYTALDFTEVH
jgi:hypothetical protein